VDGPVNEAGVGVGSFDASGLAEEAVTDGLEAGGTLALNARK